MQTVQDPEVVKAWLETEYHSLEQRAQQEGAALAWGDESGLRSDAQVGRGYAPIGQTPEIQLSTQRVRVNYIASISNQGQVRFIRELAEELFLPPISHALHSKTDGTDIHPLSRAPDCETNTPVDVACGAPSRPSFSGGATVAP